MRKTTIPKMMEPITTLVEDQKKYTEKAIARKTTKRSILDQNNWVLTAFKSVVYRVINSE
jgi:hypothetical protein